MMPRSSSPKHRRKESLPVRPEPEKGLSRRKLLAALATLGAGALGGRMALKRLLNESAPSPSLENGARAAIPYEIWSAEIRLPTLTVNLPPNWEDQMIKDFALRPELDRQAVADFCRDFRHDVRRNAETLKGISDPAQRSDFILKFLSLAIAQPYQRKLMSGAPPQDLKTNSAKMSQIIHEIDQLLLSDGFWCGAFAEDAGDGQFECFDANLRSFSRFEWEGRGADVPVFALNNRVAMSVRSDEGTIQSSGEYVTEGRYILLNEAHMNSGARREYELLLRDGARHGVTFPAVDLDRLQRDYRRHCVSHETAHAAHHRLKGLDVYSHQTLELSEPVDMGAYRILPEQFQLKPIELTEFLANAVGLMTAGSASHSVLWFLARATTKSYQPFSRFLKKEVAQWAFSRQRIATPDTLNEKDFLKSLSRMSVSDVAQIGERLAKLAWRVS